jgi:hypothetical protein
MNVIFLVDAKASRVELNISQGYEGFRFTRLAEYEP